ncbi:MAG: CHAT domain-containing protein [Nitrospinales bacterium]
MSVEDQTLERMSSESRAQLSDKFLAEGIQYFRRGDFDPAISKLEEAEHLYEQEKKPRRQCEALIQLSQVYQSIGQFDNALKSSKAAVKLAEDSGEQTLLAKALSLSGSILLGVGQTNEAQGYLDASLKISRELGASQITASNLNNLGNLYTTLKEYDKAYTAYMESVLLSKNTGNRELRGIALTNAATAVMRNGQYGKSKSLIDEALDQIRDLEDSHNKSYYLMNIGLAYQGLFSHFPESKDLLLRRSSEMFNEAARVAKKIGDNLAFSYASGYLGNLFENEQQFEEALYLTRRAIFKAQEIGAPEALFRWQWQAGRIFKALDKIDEAIDLFRSSIYTLKSIRQEKSGCYGWHHPTIGESTVQVSFELMDLLLKRAASIKDLDKNRALLIEAREVAELQKIYELRNYYQDDCVDAARVGITKLDEVSKAAVVIYPIVLKDRIEVIFTLPDGLKRFSAKVGKETLTQEIILFRKLLEKRTTREFLPHAQKLYDWLIRPMESELDSKIIDTMVFVPDGPFRTIPMAALHDGNQYLIEKYSLAVTPGLDLTDPKPIAIEIRKALIFALTQSVQGFPALPYISSELQTIQSLYTSKLLLNQDFLASNIEKALSDEKFTILHIASHAQFENDVDKTFLLSFDEKLTIDNLDQYLGPLQFRESPLELLTLSACETAAGDDLAALGLAGIAIKAGARSALATLWHINDIASSILVGEFYNQLQNPTVTKAKALQRAQLKLFNDRRFQHPGYWSAFLLISNWL